MPPKDVINDLTVTEELCSYFSPPPPYIRYTYGNFKLETQISMTVTWIGYNNRMIYMIWHFSGAFHYRGGGGKSYFYELIMALYFF